MTRWLVEISLGGERHRFVYGVAVDIETLDGGVLRFEDGIVEDITARIEARPYMSGSAQVEVGVQVVPRVDCAALSARGVRISGSPAEVSRWTEGTLYEDRRVVVVGRLREPEFGGEGAPLSATVSDALWRDTGMTGTPTQRVDGQTWSTASTLSSEHLGIQYPLVFGRPGRVSTATDARGWIPATRALWVDHTANAVSGSNLAGLILVVAGHHVASDRVWGYCRSSGARARLPVVNGFDLLDQPIAYVPWYTFKDGSYWYEGVWSAPFEYDSGAGYAYGLSEGTYDTEGLGRSGIDNAFHGDAQEQVYVGWYDDVDGDTASGGMLRGEDASGSPLLVRGAGDVISALLAYSSVQLDEGRSADAMSVLADYAIDAAVEARTQPWDWISTYLLPILPVCLASGPAGVILRVWCPTTTVVADIDLDDVEIDAPERITEDDDGSCNQVLIHFARHGATGEYVSRLTVGSALDEPSGIEAETYEVDARCDAERRSDVPLAVREISSDVICDRATAWRVILGIVDELRPYATVTFRLPEDRFRQVALWSAVRLSSTELHLDAVRARVDGIEIDGSGMLVVTASIRP